MTPGQFPHPDPIPLPGQPTPGQFPPAGLYQPYGPYPPPGSYPPQYGPYPQYGAYPQYGPYGYPGMYPPYPQGDTNGLAVASLVCGLAQLIVWVLPGILAIALGIGALQQIKYRGQDGKGMAIAGIVMGCVGVVLGVVAFVLIFHAVQQAQQNCAPGC